MGTGEQDIGGRIGEVGQEGRGEGLGEEGTEDGK